MYRGKLWTMRMFSGFGTPEDTNKRLKLLLEHGETGLSIAFDMPTLYGYDADHEKAHGEVGRCGVNVSSLRDMEVIFRGIPLDKVSTSMTINAPASVLTCMYAGVARKTGVPSGALKGTVQADMLKEYIAQKEWAYPPEAHLRIVRDMMVYCTKNMPQWNYVSISGYHIREAGSSAVQELAFTLADGFGYVELGLEAGLKVDDFAPRLSFFFNSTMDFFEEIAKFRAARRIWATVLREKYGAKNPRSLLMRFHTQTSGASLTWQQPYNNVVRTAIEALAAVLGRHPVAAHQLLRRGLGAPDRGGGPGRPQDAADNRRGDRDPERHRPARRLVLRRVAHREARAGGLQVLREDRLRRRPAQGDKVGLPPAGDSRELLQARPSASRAGRTPSSASTSTRSRRRPQSTPSR